MFQHDPQHTGRSQYTAPSRLQLKWRAQLEGMPGSPAIAADGTIYVPTGGLFFDEGPGYLYAIRPDGTQRWRHQLTPAAGDDCHPIAGYTTPAVADDGSIYVHAQPGFTPTGADCLVGTDYLFAINADGSLKWRRALTINFEGHALSSPAVGSDGMVYVGSIGGTLFGIDSTGTVQWSGPGGYVSSPAIGPDGTVYGIGTDLYAYQPDGTHKWTADLGDLAPNDTSPSVGSDGTVYACGMTVATDACRAIEPDGDQIWSFPLPDPVSSATPAISSGGTIYLGSDVVDFGLYAVLPNGTQSWHATGDFSRSPIVGGDGRLYVRDDQTGGYPPMGTLFVLNGNGSLSDDSARVPAWPGGGELSPAIGSDGTVYVSEPNKFGVSYDPTDQHLGAYVQGRRLTVNVSNNQGGGRVTGVGIDCELGANHWFHDPNDDCVQTYREGAAVTLQATPDTGSLFSGWSGACAGAGACVLAMTADKAVTASFTMAPSPPDADVSVDESADSDDGASLRKAIKKCKKKYPKGKKRKKCIKRAKRRYG